jgi:hypothetical protein
VADWDDLFGIPPAGGPDAPTNLWLQRPSGVGGMPGPLAAPAPPSAPSAPATTFGTTLTTSQLTPSMMGMPGMPMDEGQRDAVIRTVAGEASNNPTEQAAVTHVIFNRLNAGNFGNSLADVATAPLPGYPGYHQFSSWNAPNKGGTSAGTGLKPNDPTYTKIGNVVDGVNSGAISDPTKGAVNYYAPQGMPGGRPPSWAPGLVKSGYTPTRIGQQIFYQPPGAAPTVVGALGG